jgi:hypothetical protein
MTRLKLLGAVAVVATVMASPVMAQEVIYNPGYCAQFHPDANCQNKGPGNPYTGDYQRGATYNIVMSALASAGTTTGTVRGMAAGIRAGTIIPSAGRPT